MNLAGEKHPGAYVWFLRLLAGLSPLLLGALVTIAWQNSHNITGLTRDVENIQTELAHLRVLVERGLSYPPPSDKGRTP